jgi:hypothetical protein
MVRQKIKKIKRKCGKNDKILELELVFFAMIPDHLFLHCQFVRTRCSVVGLFVPTLLDLFKCLNTSSPSSMCHFLWKILS